MTMNTRLTCQQPHHGLIQNVKYNWGEGDTVKIEDSFSLTHAYAMMYQVNKMWGKRRRVFMRSDSWSYLDRGHATQIKIH